MAAPAARDDFYASLPVFSDFTQVTDEARFATLPDGWVVGVADIVQSTKAIAENRYKGGSTWRGCFTSSPTSPNHVHFIDGADGGYATAASAMKAS
jgi:hypothetical protein